VSSTGFPPLIVSSLHTVQGVRFLTQPRDFWFDNNKRLCPTHVLEYPTPNVVIGKHLNHSACQRSWVARLSSGLKQGTSVLTYTRKVNEKCTAIVFLMALRDQSGVSCADQSRPILQKSFDGGRRCSADGPKKIV